MISSQSVEKQNFREHVEFWPRTRPRWTFRDDGCKTTAVKHLERERERERENWERRNVETLYAILFEYPAEIYEMYIITL